MEQTILGRTKLKVSVMGLGCGGPSHIGMKTGKTEAESVAIIRQGFNAGINYIDTSEVYGTEEIVGKALKGTARDNIVISTKKWAAGITPRDVQKSLEKSLKSLGTDYIDIYNLHGPSLENYDYLVSEIIPVFQKMREQGKIRFIGITEGGKVDPQHAMLQRALQDEVWDVMLVGFNILNQSARDRVFIKAIEKNIGIVVMYAVRVALSKPERLREVIRELIEKKEIDYHWINVDDPLGFLIHEGGAVSLTDAAYRFCRYEPGTHVILSGTGNPDHLKANIDSFYRLPLPQEDLTKLKFIFQNVSSILGN